MLLLLLSAFSNESPTSAPPKFSQEREPRFMPQFSFGSPRSDNCLQLIPSLNVYFVFSDDTEATSSRNRLSVDSIELAWLGWSVWTHWH